MTEDDKKLLVENCQGATLDGLPCKLAGWKTDECGISGSFPGFWRTSWETAARVMAGNKNFSPADVRFVSLRWFGCGVELTPALKRMAGIE